MKFLYLPLFALTSLSHVIGQPRFDGQTIDDSIVIGYGIALGDMDGDGKPDILLADKKQIVWYRNGDWKKSVMIENLTTHDNVCIAARDIDGDGKVEVAVGAQWNPGETSDTSQSGSVYYLLRPADPAGRWQAVRLHHEPTVHRMQWVKYADKKYCLVVVPLHGRGNKAGNGQGVKVLAYFMPGKNNQAWTIDTIANSMHLTHNFFVTEKNNQGKILLAGKEGVSAIAVTPGNYKAIALNLPGMTKGAGEIQMGKAGENGSFVATIEPMHGNELVIYPENVQQRLVLDSSFQEGHALGTGDFFNNGNVQVVMGWRQPGKNGKVGIKIYEEKKGAGWQSSWVDENGMACEDLKVMDLNGDGKPDIIASGRATHNLKIYWNKN